ncbi:MAG TPA: sigma 54-interacting transcriptional regulator [Candidatus Binatia bacterium]|jgi:transcriptional regulator with PAS, ATPase and Fis domain
MNHWKEAGDFGVIAGDPLMLKLRELILRAAPTDATVLITGETGTGKELVARTIHETSLRSQGPFVPINCAAIPQELLESELFGHARGAFTGAVAPRPGLFQLAKGGTLLLDEVAELPLALQAKLLRVLQDHEIKPLGADRSVPVDVRVIASTNKDLEVEVAKGTFRQDLFYRLQVIPIIVPPLRARRSDIPLLVHHFLAKTNGRYNDSVQISTEAMVHLWEYDWPGNVRQLENMVEQLVILSSKDRIDVEDLPACVGADKTRASNLSWSIDDENLEELPAKIAEPQKTNPCWPIDDEGLDLQQALEQLEFHLIDEALRLAKGKKSAAAQLLRLKRTTLVAKLRRRRQGPLPAALSANSLHNLQKTGFYARDKSENETQNSEGGNGERVVPLRYRRAQ